jgi:hypothetical protein
MNLPRRGCPAAVGREPTDDGTAEWVASQAGAICSSHESTEVEKRVMHHELASGIDRAVFGSVGRDKIEAWLRRHLRSRVGIELSPDRVLLRTYRRGLRRRSQRWSARCRQGAPEHGRPGLPQRRHDLPAAPGTSRIPGRRWPVPCSSSSSSCAEHQSTPVGRVLLATADLLAIHASATKRCPID